MDTVRIEDIILLGRWRDGPCISIFVPTHRGGAETLQGPIRLKNRLREAEQQLEQIGQGDAGHELLAPLRKLIDDHEFWQHQSDGLAVYRAPGFLRTFRLPIPQQDLVVVTDRFHINPVLRMLSEGERFFVLALSQQQVRLLRCTRFTEHEMELPAEVSAALTEASDAPEMLLQAHSVGGGPQGGAIFHGNPVGGEESKTRLLTRFQRMDRSLREILGRENTPLVLACVEYLFPIYREACTYDGLSPQAIAGNPDGLQNEELRERAWRIVESAVTSRRARLVSAFREAAASGRASGDVGQVLTAATDGRVDSLLVPVGVQKWGRFDPASRLVEMHAEAGPGDEDLIDLAAILTLEHGGSVLTAPPDEMPDQVALAAVFRY